MIHICDLRAAPGLKLIPCGMSAKKRTSAPPHRQHGLFSQRPPLKGGRLEGGGVRGGGWGGGSMHFNGAVHPAHTLNKFLVSNECCIHTMPLHRVCAVVALPIMSL